MICGAFCFCASHLLEVSSLGLWVKSLLPSLVWPRLYNPGPFFCFLCGAYVQANSSRIPIVLGLSFGWSYALAAFTLTVTGCLPLALLVTMHVPLEEGARASALMTSLPLMALAIAGVTAVVYFTWLRQRVQWQRHALMLMWALSALGMVGWWKI